MGDHRNLDLPHVYHNGDTGEPPDGDDTQLPSLGELLDVPACSDEPGRMFVLCAAPDLDPDDPPEAAEPPCSTRELHEDDAVIGRGIETAEEAFVRLRGSEPHERVFGAFTSAERARRFYSRWGELYLVYCPPSTPSALPDAA